MKIIAVQYSALYTVELEGKTFIRQFSKFDKGDPDTVVWYIEDTDGSMIPITDTESETFTNLESIFNNTIE